MTRSLCKAKKELTVHAQTLENKVIKRTAQLEQSINELKDAQAQLILREKMASLGELTAGIAHEIQNPLNFVTNFSELNLELFADLKSLLQNETLSEQAEKNIKALLENATQNMIKINHHGKRADSIVKSMLLHSSETEGEIKPTDINSLIEEYLKLGYHGVKAKDPSFIAYLQTEFDENLEKIEVIPQHIGRVFLNLLNNSFYSISKKRQLVKGNYEPTVFVSTKKVSGGIEVKVRDNGLGMNEKDVNKVYQPFYTTKPAGEGIGLGLSLCYDIITKGHGGQMKIDTKEGEFAEFSFILPTSETGKEMQTNQFLKQESDALSMVEFFNI
jgi:signal transduction histidine kinase